MRVDPKSLLDGISVLNQGMDSGNAPNSIGRAKAAFARNVTFRGGFPSTRPGWRKRPLTFESAQTQTRFEDALYQGSSGFEPYNGGDKLISSIGGRLFRIDVDDFFKCAELTASLTTLNSATLPTAWMVQAEDFHITQNGESAALIYDGTGVRRVDPSSVPKEIPVGTAMEYANGRIWLVRPQCRSFVAGDLVGGDSGTPLYNQRDSVLKFTENEFLNGGGEFGIPLDAGCIRALRAIANLDTSLGQGPLQVMAERGMFSVNAPFDREAWHDVEYPIQTVSLIGSGARSQESSILVNGDIWFRSGDGIRSFQVARRDFNSWVNTPLSTEMHEIIRYDDPTLLGHSSALLFDNRYLVTASPFRVRDHGVAHRGLIVLDFHTVSGIGARSTPVYDGLWTGLNVLQLVPLRDRCFLFVLNASDKIELWELTRDDPHDTPVAGTSTRIASFLDSPRFGFVDNGWDLKELTTGDAWFSDVRGTVSFNVQFRPDNYPAYLDWHTWSVDAKDETCLNSDVGCNIVTTQQPQYRPRQRFPLPSESCNSRVNLPYRRGYEFQTRLAWTGHARVDRLRLVAHQVDEDSAPYCEPSESTDTTGLTACDSSLFSYNSAP